MKKKISLVISIVLILSTIFSINVFAANPTVYSQRDSRWSSYSYGKGKTNGSWWNASIGTSGCALLSITNAVYHLNGNFISPKLLADLALSNGDRKNGSGTADPIVEHAADKYGNQYGFKYVGNVTTASKLKTALQKGQVAVWHKAGHFLAIVEYDSKKGFLILNSDKGAEPKGEYLWLTQTQLTQYTSNGRVYLLLENTASNKKESNAGTSSTIT